MAKRSSLNPLANTFIPSCVTRGDMLNSDSEVFTTKRISITTTVIEIYETVIKTKKVRGEDHITKCELFPIGLDLLSRMYNLKSTYEFKRAESYLQEKIPSTPLSIEGNRKSKSLIPGKTNPRIYDFSSFQKPAKTSLLVAFYGLNRHEQAFRPMLSLVHRPGVLKNRVWSLTDEDLKLWNPFIVEPCGCPPMFGYHIPADFFGNPFNLRNPCSKKQVHLCRSEESLKGNDFILLEQTRNDQVAEAAFVEFQEKLDSGSRSDLDYYSKQMKEIVNSVYSIIDDFDTTENLTSNVMEDTTDEGSISCASDSLWNTKNLELITPMRDQFIEDDHPLLNAELNKELNAEEPFQEVPIEIKELLRRSFSNELDTDVATNSCDPPCSVWCSKEMSNSTRTGRNSDSSAIDLLNETTKFLTDISYPETVGPSRQFKPSYKRSFSANDGDYGSKYTSSLSSYKIRRGSNDSGISSQEDDVFGEESEETSDKAPMWPLFSGEHSLWKPLPITEQSKSTQKRARDLKRQTSSVN